MDMKGSGYTFNVLDAPPPPYPIPNHTLLHPPHTVAVVQVRQDSRQSLWDMLTMKQLKHLVAGGVAGAVSRTCVSPLERMKILFQVNNLCYHSNLVLHSKGLATGNK